MSTVLIQESETLPVRLSTTSFRSSASSYKRNRIHIDSFGVSSLLSDVDSAFNPEKSGANAAMDHLLLQWSLEKISDYLSQQQKSYQMEIAAQRSLLAALEANKKPSSRKLAMARSFVAEHDTEVFEVLEPEGIATQSYTFKLLKATTSPILHFELKTRFPIRKVDREIVPQSAVAKKKVVWGSDCDLLGVNVFRNQLTVRRTQSCTATVTLYGRKKEIYFEEIMRNKGIIQEVQDLLKTITHDVEKAQRELTEATKQDSYYSHALEVCKKDLKRMTDAVYATSENSVGSKSLHSLATKLGLEIKVEPAWFPDVAEQAKATVPLIAEKVQMLLKEKKYLDDQENRITTIATERLLVLGEIKLELTTNLRNPEHKPEDIFDGARQGCEDDCREADSDVAEEAGQLLRTLDEEWGEFEEQCMEGLVESKTEMLEDAYAAWAEAKKIVQDSVKRSVQEQRAYAATMRVFSQSAVPIGIFASVDHRRDMLEEYMAMYHDFKVSERYQLK